jgi:hypothetical protein
MKAKKIVCACLLAGLSVAQVQGVEIITDNFNVAGSGTGFDLGSGVNSGINPPATRLTGFVSTNLRYYSSVNSPAKTNTAFTISGNKLRVNSASNPGRFTLSTNGVTPFDFGPALGSVSATPANPMVYDLAIKMVNNSSGTQRFSFAIAAEEGDATTWDFGVQIFRTASSDSFYTIQKRIDLAASGLSSDLNSFITNTAPGTAGSEIPVVVRVTDAGAEPTAFHSRVQVSIDGGTTWIYDTSTDPDLPHGWRFNGPGRYILWDQAPSAGPVTYDDFSVRTVPVSAAAVFPPDGAANLNVKPTLKVAVTNALSGNLNVTFYGRELGNPYPGPDFMIPVLPDTQNYAREAAGSGDATRQMWYAQTEWIITNRVVANIPYVAQLGDIVQNGDTKNGGPNSTEWSIATNAMYRLEDPSRTLLREGIPYGCSVGNHDQDPNGDEDGTTKFFNQNFGTAHFSGKSYYGGHYSTNNDSFFDLFSVSGLDFIVFSYEFGRYGSGVLDWTENVLATNQNRRIIVMTHYAGGDCGGTSCGMSTQGEAIYNRLKTYPNFFLMMGGHVFNGNGDGEGRSTDTYNGNTVYTLVSDFQGRLNGGNGLMRLMYFSPSNNTIRVKTYSPYTDTYETDASSQFTLSYNMQLPTGPGTPGTPYAAIGTITNVASGTIANFTWSGLSSLKNYEWYAVVTDADGNTFTTARSQFHTASNIAPIAGNEAITMTGDTATNLMLDAVDGNGDALTFQVNSPTEGLLLNFDPTNGTVTYLPAHGFHGSDRFTFSVSDGIATSSLATMNIFVNPPTDTNSNGLPDNWETRFGITDPTADKDGDGQNNLAEYLANTNPTNATSLLRVINANVQSNGAFGLSWSAIGGTRYRVQSSDTINGVFTDIQRPVADEMNNGSPGADSTQSFIDTPASTNGTRYYRVKVVP